MYIAVDFDGTCVKNRFPEVGEDIGAVPYLKQLIKHGHKLILITCRNHPNPKFEKSIKDLLTEATDWFKNNGIELFGVNENPEHKSDGKVYADYIIDDCSIGIPTLIDQDGVSYVDWNRLGKLMKTMRLI